MPRKRSSPELRPKERAIAEHVAKFPQGIGGPALGLAVGLRRSTLHQYVQKLVLDGLVVRCGAGPVSRYCTPANMKTCLAGFSPTEADRLRARMLARSRGELPAQDVGALRQLRVSAATAPPIGKRGPSSVFELSEFMA